jgi:DNA-directed RNA polymerase specialized sigma24 family protein
MEFAEYVARQRPALMRFATVLTCRTWLAEDLVSDVLGRAFERWERISGMAEPNAYVRRMVVNEYLSWRRRLTRTSPRAEVEPMVISDGADERAERDAMIRRLAGLPRKQRAAVVLRYYAGQRPQLSGDLMSDLRTLHDAFAELERRADAVAGDAAPVVRPRRAVRLVPIAATVAAVAGLVAGAVWLVPGDPGTYAASPPTTSSSTAPSTTTARGPVPTSPDDLIARFRTVLGDTATFEVTERINVPPPSSTSTPQPGTGSVVTPHLEDAPTSALIGGTLTSAGVTGGFSLTIYPSDSEPGVWCGYSRTEDCDVSTLPDGSRLATGTAQPAPGAVSHLACRKRPDGTMVLMHVSNQEDPRGAEINSPGGAIYSPQPPLTLDQLKAIVTSDKW